MLRENSQPLCPERRTICFVIPGNSIDVIVYYRRIVKILADRGWFVHVLTFPANSEVISEFAALGADIIHPNEFSIPSRCRIEGPNQTQRLLDSDSVRHVLSHACAQKRITLVECIDQGGLAFRSIQAKRHRLDFSDVSFLVTKHGMSRTVREIREEWLEHPLQLAEDFAEQYSIDNADVTVDLMTSHWHDAEIVNYYEQQTRKCSPSPSISQRQPSVTVGIAHFNLGQFLPDTLASLAEQSYDNLEVVVIDDGSTDAYSKAEFERMQSLYPQYRFLTQKNVGIGATRNRALELANGKYFLPMDADNIAHPDMVSTLVNAMEANPDLAAVSCYFLAFRDREEIQTGDFSYSYRPIGGPRLLASMLNVYGDGNALFSTERLRLVGGYSTDRDTSWEDWEVFIKLARAGLAIDVVPEFLFYYRHRDDGFSRETNGYRNRQRILRWFESKKSFSDTEMKMLMNLLISLQSRLEEKENDNRAFRKKLTARRYRLVDRAHALVKSVGSLIGF